MVNGKEAGTKPEVRQGGWDKAAASQKVGEARGRAARPVRVSKLKHLHTAS